MDLEENLKKLGLSDKEAAIYLLLLRLGRCPAAEISKRTGINRRSVYDCLESLISLGLVNYVIVEKKKTFGPNNLDSLYASIEEKKNTLESLKPELKKFLLKREAEPAIRIFSGRKSMKGVFEGLLENRQIIFIYGGAMTAKDFLKYYYPQWTKRRERYGIQIKGIFIDLPEVRSYVKSLPLASCKFIPAEFLSPTTLWWLQGNRIYLVFFQEPPIIIAIESAGMAKTYSSSFNLLWKKL